MYFVSTNQRKTVDNPGFKIFGCFKAEEWFLRFIFYTQKQTHINFGKRAKKVEIPQC